MKNFEYTCTALAPVSVQEWSGQPYADIPLIPGLGVNSERYRYVSQGFEREVKVKEDVSSLGSDGYTLCSGLVMTDPEARSVTMAHLEPHSEAIIGYLGRNRADSIRRVALFYGSLSVRQFELENLISENYFGPMRYTATHFDSGNAAWGMVFHSSLKHVKIFTRQPSQAIATYEL